MERKRIICPETGHEEEIDIERTPHGAVITGCSRFDPRRAVTCGGPCAVVIDRDDRRDVDDRTERVLVVVASGHGPTNVIAELLARYLAQDGFTVERADADARTSPAPADYDAVVIGSRVRFGRHPPSVIAYIAHHRDDLATMPAYFFAVGGRVDRMTRATGWHPMASEVFDVGWIDEVRVHELAARIGENVPPLEIDVAWSEPRASS